MARKLSDDIIEFIETYLRVPSGDRVAQPLKLAEFQKDFIRDVYDNPHGTRRAYLSIGRKNGKTALIAALVIVHLCCAGVARQNSQIISGARSRDQASLVFDLAYKMVMLSPDLTPLISVRASQRELRSLTMNVTYKAIAAEAATAHGLSPVLAIIDELGQVKGSYDPFVESIVTAQGAYDSPLLIVISTQAATDADLFSIWLDDAEREDVPTTVSHVYSAPEGCDLLDEDAWRAANPALGLFRSERDLRLAAESAKRVPTEQNTFRLYNLNQRVEAKSPFINIGEWKDCAGETVQDFKGLPVFAGLDLSETRDLTAFVMIAQDQGIWHIKPTFWLPAEGLREKAESDRVPYDIWRDHGFLSTCPSAVVEYEYIAHFLHDACRRYDIKTIAFDRWNYRHLKPWLLQAGFKDFEVEEGDRAIFRPFGQGTKDMSPALRTLETLIANRRIRHNENPIMNMCAVNAVAETDAQGGKKLIKKKSSGRIDGLVALAMAVDVAASGATKPKPPVIIDPSLKALFA